MPGASRAGSRSCPTALPPRRFFLPSAGICSRPREAPRPFSGTAAAARARSQGTFRHRGRQRPGRGRPQRGRGAQGRAHLRAALQLSHRRRRRVLLGRPDRPGSGQPRRRGAGRGPANCCPPARRPCWCIDTTEDGKPAGTHDSLRLGLCRRASTWRAGASRSTGSRTTEPAGSAPIAPCASTSSRCFPSCSRRSWPAA